MLKQNIKCIPSRLVLARKEKGLSQAQMVALINEQLPPDKEITVSYVSLWETGRRACSGKYHNILENILGVTKEYLCGITDWPNKRDEEYVDNKEDSLMIQPIMFKDIFKYDRQPIYIVFKNYEHSDEWGIYNAKTNEVICTDFKIELTQQLSEKVKLYSTIPVYAIPYHEIYEKRMSFKEVISAGQVYVIMKSKEEVIRKLYNGWYKHNENHTALIKDNGLVLPYDGLGVSYVAYSDNL